MTGEMHKAIIKFALKELLGDIEGVSDAIGFPVTARDVEWCILHPVFDLVEVEYLTGAAISAMNLAEGQLERACCAKQALMIVLAADELPTAQQVARNALTKIDPDWIPDKI